MINSSNTVTQRRLAGATARNTQGVTLYLWIFDATPGTAVPVNVVDVIHVANGNTGQLADTLCGEDGYAFDTGICAAWSTTHASYTVAPSFNLTSFTLYVIAGS